jgi:predicted Fe-Mo cluster-binding NifX family protein
MKVAITSSGNDINSQFNPRFGRCDYFIIVDTDTKDWEALQNPAVNATGGAGPQAVQFIAQQGVEAVIGGRFGGNAYNAIATAGIQAFSAGAGTVSEVLDKYLAGELRQVSGASGPGFHGN